MSDPVFTERAELEAWAGRTARDAQAHQNLGERRACADALVTIRRVTLAHMHLIAEPEEDAYGRTGEKSDCDCCGGTGVEYGETCVVCGGFGWVCAS